MSTVLVIGAGGVSSVCVHKMAMNAQVFSSIHLASRTKAKCDAIATSVQQRTGQTVQTYEIDAEGAKRVHSVNVRGFATLPTTFEVR